MKKLVLFLLSFTFAGCVGAISFPSPAMYTQCCGTPTVTQTPAASLGNTIREVVCSFGDSYTFGSNASIIGTNDWITLVLNQTCLWYPSSASCDQHNDGVPGTTAYDFFVPQLPTYPNGTLDYQLQNIVKPVWFVSRFTLWWGQNESRISNSSGEPGAFYLATQAQAQTYSQNYKSEIQFFITDIKSIWTPADPIQNTATYQCQIFLLNMPDVSTAGGGAMTQFDPGNWPNYVADLAIYNQRLQELANNNSGVYLVNIHDALYGCGGCFDFESTQVFPHPTNLGQRIIRDTVLTAISSPPR